MKIIAINGSPRKKGNTATLCEEFLKGAKSVRPDVETEIINLYELNYTGCKSCFACKRTQSNTYGTCIIPDDLQKIIDRISTADGIVLGSPIYFGDITGQMRCFLERLLFPYVTYETGYKTIAPKHMSTAMIYTMNVTQEIMKQFQYDMRISHIESFIERVFSKPQAYYAYNTYQFDNYNNYKVEVFSESDKAEYKQLQFPRECQRAFNGGIAMIKQISEGFSSNHI